MLALFLGCATSASAALPRTTGDRPDDVPGPQVHVVYAVPSDQADAGLDADGTLESSIAALQAYLRSQTGGPGLRLDTSGGALDVTFVRLPRTDADYAAQPEIASAIADDLRAAGLGDQTKVYAVYYEGSAPGPIPSFALCGEGGRISTGAVAVVILHDDCGFDLSSSRAGTAGAIEFVLLHETLHALGFVPDCAPHATRDGHVNDSGQDLMASVLPQGTPTLDVNHDDYFQANVPGCLDLTQSRYVEGAGTTVTIAVAGTGHGHVRSGIALEPFGTVDCPPACSVTFDGGRPVIVPLVATADSGYVFLRWDGACSGTDRACAVETSTSTSATAIFARAPLPLTVSVEGGGAVVSAPAGISCPSRCSASFAFGGRTQLRAKPKPGFRFAGWSGACNGRVPCILRPTRPLSVRATFRRA